MATRETYRVTFIQLPDQLRVCHRFFHDSSGESFSLAFYVFVDSVPVHCQLLELAQLQRAQRQAGLRGVAFTSVDAGFEHDFRDLWVDLLVLPALIDFRDLFVDFLNLLSNDWTIEIQFVAFEVFFYLKREIALQVLPAVS